MADYVRAEQTIKRIRYELRTPTVAAELDKAMNAAARSFNEIHHRSASYDDDLRISVEDELLVIWFEVTA